MLGFAVRVEDTQVQSLLCLSAIWGETILSFTNVWRAKASPPIPSLTGISKVHKLIFKRPLSPNIGHQINTDKRKSQKRSQYYQDSNTHTHARKMAQPKSVGTKAL